LEVALAVEFVAATEWVVAPSPPVVVVETVVLAAAEVILVSVSMPRAVLVRDWPLKAEGSGVPLVDDDDGSAAVAKAAQSARVRILGETMAFGIQTLFWRMRWERFGDGNFGRVQQVLDKEYRLWLFGFEE
jgi:predicted branched-subunit amino acid permease